jgi:predicted metal-binding protein
MVCSRKSWRREALSSSPNVSIGDPDSDFSFKLTAWIPVPEWPVRPDMMSIVERDAFAGGLPGDARSRYEAIQRGRPGFVAVVPVNAMVCGGCRTGLTPNLVNQVMKGKEIITCESCSRILYIVPKPAEPASSNGANAVSTPAVTAEPPSTPV